MKLIARLSNEVVTVSGLRTTDGTMGGSLKNVHDHDLRGLVIIVHRND